jgi:hypothetical protein
LLDVGWEKSPLLLGVVTVPVRIKALGLVSIERELSVGNAVPSIDVLLVPVKVTSF